METMPTSQHLWKTPPVTCPLYSFLQAKRVQLELLLERQQRIIERLLDGAAAALPTANLEQVKAGSLELGFRDQVLALEL